MARKPYATDLSDEQWEVIQPLLPSAKSSQGRGRKQTVNLREIVNAILYWSRSGCAWELLPHDLPPAKTVYSYFRKWQKQGVWQRIHDRLRQQVRQKEQREEQPSAGIIDSQSVKTTDVGGRDREFDGGKKVNGRKRHIIVDTLGLVLVVLVHAANVADVTAARLLLAEAALSQPSVDYFWADQGYRGKPLQQVAHGCQLQLEVVKRTSQVFQVQPRRWVVERTFAWLGRQRRLSKDYERLPEVSETVVQVAMIPLMLNRLVS